MNEMGYTQFHGIDCIFRENESLITLIPSNPQDNIVKYFTERDFIFDYKGVTYNRIAFIEKIQSQLGHSIKLISKYVFEFIEDFSISGFEIYGGAIDDFFNPVNYFYPKAHKGEQFGDVLYHKECADSWNVSFEGRKILISLSYGNVLSNGVGSDLMLHPKLNVHFDNKTNDIYLVHKVYSIVIKFLQIVRYDLNFGRCKVELFNEEGHFKGRFYDFSQYSYNFTAKVDTNYRYLKEYVGKLMQFSSDNLAVSLTHLPCSTMRFGEDDYNSAILVSIFGAFENEYKLAKNIYGKTDISKIQNIKRELTTKIQDLHSNRKLTIEEKQFINMAKSRISDIGVEFGQAKKIQKVYETLIQALQSSIDGIFYYFDKNTQKNILKGKLNRISSDLADLRAKAAHGEILEKYSPIQAQEIRFLEILVYAQMLKRAGFDDSSIELMIGVVFMCNFKCQEIDLNNLK